jgi:hypothetical protein
MAGRRKLPASLRMERATLAARCMVLAGELRRLWGFVALLLIRSPKRGGVRCGLRAGELLTPELAVVRGIATRGLGSIFILYS